MSKQECMERNNRPIRKVCNTLLKRIQGVREGGSGFQCWGEMDKEDRAVFMQQDKDKYGADLVNNM
eukprot:7031788-Pyramimonas_sp.AAC.1